MKQVYLDNAATTPLLPEVIDEMTKIMTNYFGNPSSTHSFGRKAKNVIETYRKEVASHFGALPAEIIFTANGTEANNIAIKSCILNHEVNHIITSNIEHKAVLNTVKAMAKINDIEISYVNILPNGEIDYNHLEEILSSHLPKKTLVSLMLANNETGVILNAKKVSELCKTYSSLFHSDTVQYIAHYPINFMELGIDYATCSAHKFHGPKGVGFLYAQKKMKLTPHTYGGGQERDVKSGTENIIGITGLTKALHIGYNNLDIDKKYITDIKHYLLNQLTANFKDKFYVNGIVKESLYTILNISVLKEFATDMMLFQLDMKGVAASQGSACSSGSNQGSHVMREIYGKDHDDSVLRFSFSKLTTKDDIDYCIEKLKNLVK
jgi:cysteine desulfurase